MAIWGRFHVYRIQLHLPAYADNEYYYNNGLQNQSYYKPGYQWLQRLTIHYWTTIRICKEDSTKS